MSSVRIVILGAGPAGLSLAHRLLQLGEESFVVLEKEEAPGGLCRSVEVDGAPLDLGGGHFLDVKRPEINRFLFGFLSEEQWNTYDRKSTIQVQGVEIEYPFEANLWQFPIERQLDYLESVARAGCVTGAPMPDTFPDWVRWKLGDRIAEDYMIPYNRKIWCLDDLVELGTYWLYKLPDVSFRETLESCLRRRLAGTMPAHRHFYYPREGGYGHVWKIMGEQLGDRLLCGRDPQRIELEPQLRVDEYECERIVSTIPWPEFCRAADSVPDAVRDGVSSLKHASIEVAYRPENLPGPAHWTYIPSPELPHHRLLLRHNFCPGSRGHWTETNVSRASGPALWRHASEYSYPLNTVGKPDAIATVLDWGRREGIVGLGRWGEWEHMNSDAAVEAGLRLADELCA